MSGCKAMMVDMPPTSPFPELLMRENGPVDTPPLPLETCTLTVSGAACFLGKSATEHPVDNARRLGVPALGYLLASLPWKAVLHMQGNLIQGVPHAH